ncbi:hypothetical protein TNCV_214781 [Trichonephila clavipes]|nr:hypothetical protein TNCV_214781 [Trichonephila clavipes]
MASPLHWIGSVISEDSPCKGQCMLNLSRPKHPTVGVGWNLNIDQVTRKAPELLSLLQTTKPFEREDFEFNRFNVHPTLLRGRSSVVL